MLSDMSGVIPSPWYPVVYAGCTVLHCTVCVLGCGGVFTDTSGVIPSPGYPTAYTDNLRCNYTILADPEHYILLSFDPSVYGLEG